MQSIILLSLFCAIGVLFALMLFYDNRARNNMLEKSYGSEFFTKYNATFLAYFKNKYMGMFNETGLAFVKRIRILIVLQLMLMAIMIIVASYKAG